MANKLSVILRNAVSKQRKRYTEDGYNLDLAYISDNIIAMGYPADSIESLYRNRLIDVYKFLEENHSDHYKVYNLCRERSYDINKFHGRVAPYPFEDHNPPTIELIESFCKDVDSWLKAHELNVAAVHCKAGKGRTGTMICCYLLYCGLFSSAEEALACYAEKRTKDCKGVTIPSQRRYVQYFSKLISSRMPYRKEELQLLEIQFSKAPILMNQTANCSIFTVEKKDDKNIVKEIYNSTIEFRKSFTLGLKSCSLVISGDIKIELSTSRKKSFHFWFNTFFVKDKGTVVENGRSEQRFLYVLSKNEIDDIHKTREHKGYPEDFEVRLVFSNSPEPSTGTCLSQTNITSDTSVGNSQFSASSVSHFLNISDIARETRNENSKSPIFKNEVSASYVETESLSESQPLLPEENILDGCNSIGSELYKVHMCLPGQGHMTQTQSPFRADVKTHKNCRSHLSEINKVNMAHRPVMAIEANSQNRSSNGDSIMCISAHLDEDVKRFDCNNHKEKDGGQKKAVEAHLIVTVSNNKVHNEQVILQAEQLLVNKDLHPTKLSDNNLKQMFKTKIKKNKIPIPDKLHLQCMRRGKECSKAFAMTTNRQNNEQAIAKSDIADLRMSTNIQSRSQSALGTTSSSPENTKEDYYISLCDGQLRYNNGGYQSPHIADVNLGDDNCRPHLSSIEDTVKNAVPKSRGKPPSANSFDDNAKIGISKEQTRSRGGVRHTDGLYSQHSWEDCINIDEKLSSCKLSNTSKEINKEAEASCTADIKEIGYHNSSIAETDTFPESSKQLHDFETKFKYEAAQKLKKDVENHKLLDVGFSNNEDSAGSVNLSNSERDCGS